MSELSLPVFVAAVPTALCLLCAAWGMAERWWR